MRALTMEEVAWVAGGSPLSDTERDVGNEMVLVGTGLSSNNRTKAYGKAFITVGTLLQMDADRREHQEGNSGGNPGGGGGSGDGGGNPPPVGGGGGGPIGGGGGDNGGGGPQVCYGDGQCVHVTIGNN